MKLTNEHVFGKWFRSRMEPPHLTSKATNWYQAVTAGSAPVDRDIPQSPWELTIREVCGECNRWSNQHIEVPIRALLLDLMLDRTVTVDPTAWRLIALWATRVAILRGARDAGPRAITPEQIRHVRENLEPPALTRVLVGRASAPINMWNRHLRYAVGVSPVSVAPSHSTTIVAGNLVLYVDETTDPMARWRMDAARFPKGWLQAVTEAWPAGHQAPVAWPPPRRLSVDAVVELSGRVSRRLGAPPGLTGY